MITSNPYEVSQFDAAVVSLSMFLTSESRRLTRHRSALLSLARFTERAETWEHLDRVERTYRKLTGAK